MGVIAAAAITAVGAAAGAAVAANGAKKAGKASAASASLMQQQLIDAASEAADVNNSLADELLKKSKAALGDYASTSKDAISSLKFTPVRGVLDPDEKGNTTFSKVFELFNTSDTARRARILGDAEPSLRLAMNKFAALGSGDTSGFSAELRSSDAAIAANTRGSAIGTFSNLSAANRFSFMQQGVQSATNLAGLFSSFDTATPVVAQTALTVQDEVRREAARNDAFTASKVAASLDLAHNIFAAKIQQQQSFTSLKSAAANAQANALAGAAQAGNIGAGTAGISEMAASQAITGATAAIGAGISGYQTQQIQAKQQGIMNSYLTAQTNKLNATTPSSAGTASFAGRPYDS